MHELRRLNEGNLEKELNEVLLKKSEKVVAEMGLSEEGNFKSSIMFPAIHNIQDFKFLTVGTFLENNDYETSKHSIRVGLYCTAIANYLGIFDKNPQLGRDFVQAGFMHDIGKAFVESVGLTGYTLNGGGIYGYRPKEERTHLVNKKTGFTKEDQEKMKDHVDVGLVFVEEPIKSIIANHHAHQKNPVLPKTQNLKNSKESYYLSRLLALSDFNDAASTRENDRNGYIPIVSELKKTKELLINEYENLSIKYNGSKLPKINTTGRDLIEELYDANIFGRENPKDPFSESYFNFEYNTDLTLPQKFQLAKEEMDLIYRFKISPKIKKLYTKITNS